MSKAQQRAKQIIDEFRGVPGEYYMLKGIVSVPEEVMPLLRYIKIIDIQMIAQRMDEINEEGKVLR